jgi:hypothetical protein
MDVVTYRYTAMGLKRPVNCFFQQRFQTLRVRNLDTYVFSIQRWQMDDRWSQKINDFVFVPLDFWCRDATVVR